MKGLFAVLAAAAALGTARALPSGWTDWQSSGPTALTSNTWSVASNSAYGYTGNVDFAFRVTYVLDEGATLQTGQAWAALLVMDLSETYYQFQTSAVGGDATVWTSGAGATTMQTPFSELLAANDNRISFGFDYDDSASTLEYYVNDVLVDTQNGVDINAWVTFKAGVSDGDRPLDRIFPTDGSVSYETAFSTTRAPTIPEPTALALLALGVAAAALRRRG